MKLTATPLNGVVTIEFTEHTDERGSFARAFCHDTLAAVGLTFSISQINISSNTHAFTLRGMHWAKRPQTEAKIVFVKAGRIFDAVVDLRAGSPTYCRWFGMELDAKSARSLHIPEGCAHGFLTLEPASEVVYLMNKPHVAGFDRGARWDDPHFGIVWPTEPSVISQKDKTWPDFDPRLDVFN